MSHAMLHRLHANVYAVLANMDQIRGPAQVNNVKVRIQHCDAWPPGRQVKHRNGSISGYENWRIFSATWMASPCGAVEARSGLANRR